MGDIYTIAKILFVGKANTKPPHLCIGVGVKIVSNVEPLFVRPRGARLRAERQGFIRAKSMGGSASRPPNGLRKTEKYGSNVFIQLRSNLLYQKLLNKSNRSATPLMRRHPSPQKFHSLIEKSFAHPPKIEKRDFRGLGCCADAQTKPLSAPTKKAMEIIFRLDLLC
jgi:hypothetical protein